MDRRVFLKYSALTSAVTLASSPFQTTFGGQRWYQQRIVIDGLGGLGDPSGRSPPNSPLTAALLQDVKNSGLTVIHTTVGAVGTMAPLAAFEKMMREIDYYEREIENSGGVLQRVRTVADIVIAKKNGRTGLIYGLQDGVAFADDLDRLSAIYRAGVRAIQPTYNRRNLLGDGCMEPSDAGLSVTGVEAIKRLCDLGFTIDMSHCGRKAFSDAITHARQPVSVTHSGCYALAPHPRLRTDEEIRAIAKSGGVFGIYVMPYLSNRSQPTADDVIRHVEHAIKIAGEDHVSIGTDGYVSATTVDDIFKEQFKKMVDERQRLGIATPGESETSYLFVNDLNMPWRLEVIAEKRRARRHRDAVIAKVIGGNLQRVFTETWKG